MHLLNRRTVFAIILVASATAIAATPRNLDHEALRMRPQHREIIIRERHGSTVTSSNWSGYAVTGAKGSVSDATGSWIVPLVNCTLTPSAYSATWVGIDGYSSNTVEQIGTESDCVNDQASNYAWFEFYPHNFFTINNVAIKAGDEISAEVNYAGGKFTVTLEDVSTGKGFSTSTRMNQAARSSAEWIVEAPYSGGVLPLADFGGQEFGSDNTTISGTCNATVGASSGPIGSFLPPASVFNITMTANDGTNKALPSSLSTDQSSFTDDWKSEGP